MTLLAYKKILVIDDDKFCFEYYELILKSAGCRKIHYAADSWEGLSVAKAWKPDLIILDIHHAGPAGFEIFR